MYRCTSTVPDPGGGVVIVATIGDDDRLTRAAVCAATALVVGSARRLYTDGVSGVPCPGHREQPLREAARRAHRFLDRALPNATVRVVVATGPADLLRRLNEVPRPAHLALLLVDDTATDPDAARAFDDELRHLADAMPSDIAFEPSPLTTHRYLRHGARHTDPPGASALSTERWHPEHAWVRVADVLCALVDSVQSHLLPRPGGTSREVALASTLAGFLHAQAAGRWGLHTYTGSVVARLIHDLERHARRRGNPVLRGPSEHSLACAALARWQLDEAPFLLVVTSGMVDEFRGTLANLATARARGFVLCADSVPGQWLPFQGTIHRSEDSRAVVRARGLPVVQLDDPGRLDEQLADAFRAYHDDPGPVVLFATRGVLEAPAGEQATQSGPLAVPAPRRTAAGVRESDVAALGHLLARGPDRVLCQPGALPRDARPLLLRIARRAGVALADSLTLPGVVARYQEGARVPEYLGTLSLYGYSPRVYEYLHAGGRLRPRAEQALLFFGSAVPEVDTPFSGAALGRRLHVLQTVDRPERAAPFADRTVVADAGALLRALHSHLDDRPVDPDLLDRRRAAIDRTRDSFSDAISSLPVLPMSPNYFFRRLHDLLDELIRVEDYRYTGVFDVGRGGLAAVCALPRTGPGFSGWFGRALMGDALQAVPALAATRQGNVLAFVGDGAWSLVPDIVPTLVQQLRAGATPRANVTVFRLVNGSHSVIRTYRETYRPAAVGAQTEVPSLLDAPWRRRCGDTLVTHHRIDRFDADALREQFLRPGTVDLCTVRLGHNNEGAGLSPFSALGWQRDELSPGAVALAAPRGRPREEVAR